MVMKNEKRNLVASFDTIAAQEYGGPVEIVYVDSGSTDGTIEFMRERGIEAHVIPPDEFHHARTRNLGASLARHEILVFLSGDAAPTDRFWLANLVHPFDDERVGAVYGRQMPPPGIGALRAHALHHEYPDVRAVRDPAATPKLHPGLFRFSNANGAVRRLLWERFRFNEDVLLAEDQVLCRDIFTNGWKIVYEPAAAVVHGHERTQEAMQARPSEAC
jgi:rhamnosyltransferase